MAVDDWIAPEDFAEPASATCKHCGQGGLDWLHTGERWRLVDGRGRFHVCKQYRDVKDDFEDIS